MLSPPLVLPRLFTSLNVEVHTRFLLLSVVFLFLVIIIFGSSSKCTTAGDDRHHTLFFRSVLESATYFWKAHQSPIFYSRGIDLLLRTLVVSPQCCSPGRMTFPIGVTFVSLVTVALSPCHVDPDEGEAVFAVLRCLVQNHIHLSHEGYMMKCTL